MKKYFILLFTVVTTYESFSQVGVVTDPYNSTTIPENLKTDAYTVVRKGITEFEIVEPGKGFLRESKVITILNEKGRDELEFVFGTDKFMILEEFRVKMFDARGKLLEKYDKKDLNTSSSNSGLIDDNKILHLSLSAASYPVTIEYEYTKRLNGILNPPEFNIQTSHQSVEQSVFKISYPGDIQIDYKSYNLNLKPVATNNGKKSSLEWTVSQLKPIHYEESSWSWSNNIPRIIFHSNKFEIDDYPGNLSTWKDLGVWYNQIIGNRNQLSENNKNQIKQLVAGITDEKEKVKKIYDFLQENFRYVSIQLGIGGWKPFPADFVHEKKYGDCKGLSNYMKACLSAVNIKSYYAVVNAGSDEKPLDPGFSYRGFNHIILCAVVQKDTIWLECTSSTNDFGVLGNFTENRNALLVTETGGVLVSTPKSKPVDNKFQMTTRVKVEEDGSGTIEARLFTTGEVKAEQLAISKMSADRQKSLLVNYIGFGNPDDYKIDFSHRKSIPYQTDISLTLEKVPDFVAGNKMFIKPRMYSFWSDPLPATNKRVYDYLFEYPMVKTDTTIFKIPEGYIVEVLPSTKSFSFESGSYSSKYWYDEANREVFCTATVSLNEYVISPDRYENAKQFFNKVIESENQKLIIKKR